MKLKMLCLLVTLAAGSLMAGTIHVAVDTSSLGGGASGYLDIQFNGAGNPTPFGSAGVSGFSGVSFTLDEGLAQTAGAVSGNLIPGPLTLDNTDPWNDYFVPFAITGGGSGFSFFVTLSGAMLAPPSDNTSGTVFAVLLYGDDAFTPLLTGDGLLARIDVDAAGVVSAEGFGPGTASAIPEPATAWLAAAGLLGAGVFFRRRRG